MSRLRLYLLGVPRVERDGSPVKIAYRKAVALLAYLAMEPGSHSRAALAALLWPESGHSFARAELRRALSVLNRALGKGWLTADRETAMLVPECGIWLDVDAFRELFLAACEQDPEQRPAFLRRACQGDDFVRSEVESLLASDDEAATFLQTPALGKSFADADPESFLAKATPAAIDGTEAAPPPDNLPDRIG